MKLYHTAVICPKHADRMANSVDPDSGAVGSGSTLFAQTCLSKNLESLRYFSSIYAMFVRCRWRDLTLEEIQAEPVETEAQEEVRVYAII